MSSWNDVAAAAPDLAAAVKGRFDAHKHHLLATLRRDGSPRISGTETSFVGGELWLGSMLDAMKARDLQRDPRLALHAAPIDVELAEGDAKLAGRAVEVTDEAEKAAVMAASAASGQDHEPPAAFHLFRVDVTEVVLVRVQGDELVIDTWHEGHEPRRVTRR